MWERTKRRSKLRVRCPATLSIPKRENNSEYVCKVSFSSRVLFFYECYLEFNLSDIVQHVCLLVLYDLSITLMSWLTWARCPYIDCQCLLFFVEWWNCWVRFRTLDQVLRFWNWASVLCLSLVSLVWASSLIYRASFPERHPWASFLFAERPLCYRVSLPMSVCRFLVEVLSVASYLSSVVSWASSLIYRASFPERHPWASFLFVERPLCLSSVASYVG